MKPELSAMTNGRDVHRQQGTALVFSLIILLVLTILGMSAMRTSSLEQIMAGNTQEFTRAFQAADSGMSRALSTIRNSNPADPRRFTPQTYSLSNATATASTPTPVQIGKGAPGQNMTSDLCFAFYNQSVTGNGRLNVTTTLNHGLYGLAPEDLTKDTSCS